MRIALDIGAVSLLLWTKSMWWWFVERLAGININWSKIMRINIAEWLIVAVGGNCHYNTVVLLLPMGIKCCIKGEPTTKPFLISPFFFCHPFPPLKKIPLFLLMRLLALFARLQLPASRGCGRLTHVTIRLPTIADDQTPMFCILHPGQCRFWDNRQQDQFCKNAVIQVAALLSRYSAQERKPLS